MRWRLVLEEYGPELEYIEGERNVVADTLSRLDIEDDRETLKTTGKSSTSPNVSVLMMMTSLNQLSQFAIAILPKRKKLLLPCRSSSPVIKTTARPLFVGATECTC
jgi:hypothetical protein